MATFSLTRSYCWCWWSTVEYAHTRYYSTSISTFTHRDGGLRVNATSNERKLKSNHLSNRGSDEENERTFLSFTYRDGKRYSTCSFAKKSLKKSKRDGPETFGDLSEDKFVQNDKLDTSLDLAGQNSSPIPSRSAVLQACTITSGLLAALGIVIRQVSHVASVEGLPILDCSSEVSFSFEMWHLELITGLVVLISSCRYLLLKTWADFAESSEAANQQVLSSLQPLDYMVVAFLPGISEELLFRGAILPLFGMNWKSVGVAALIFGVLHLGNGRKYSFAIWATFVGLAYGYATILSSSIAVPMASHAVNNLIGGLLWRCTSNRSAQK